MSRRQWTLGNVPFSLASVQRNKAIMSYRVLKLAGGICAVLWLAATAIGTEIFPALAQNNDAKPADQQSAAPKEGAKDSGKDTTKDTAKDGTKEPQKINEFAQAHPPLNRPPRNPKSPQLC